MSMINRIRQRRLVKREDRALDRAWQAAPTPAMRHEINIFASHRQPL
ncbi:hypothetical protein ACWT_0077 [Actinoplanes sp. SE50]|nr:MULTISPECIES: hypothetical protein [unclassified Actinoplanes]AEV81091.1 hypothetical protein ACPL_192 [Actinoplanes sp. SE50/110]ATO79492.1 hypothetical protein ACWT_0077 [Actinoplanes sp. SE50]SLL96892.1 hypothetical protein ACSP50_0081 [Actinoplanes sp. SE50/110]